MINRSSQCGFTASSEICVYVCLVQYFIKSDRKRKRVGMSSCTYLKTSAFVFTKRSKRTPESDKVTKKCKVMTGERPSKAKLI